MAETVLIVDPDAAARQTLVECFKATRYRTVAAEGFASALQLIESTRPDVLITAVRLGSHNGLHLVVRGRTLDRRMAALVIDPSEDPVLEHESLDLGATYVTQPINRDQLLQAVAGALAARERRSWSRTTVTSNVVVRVGNRRARLLEVSDSGFRLESGWLLPGEFRLDFPSIPLTVSVARVWCRRGERANVWRSGAVLTPTEQQTRERWRQLVDRLREQTVPLP